MGEDKADKIKERLVVDNDKIFEELLEGVEDILYLTEDGDAHLRVDKEELSKSEEILIYLVGSWFSSEANLRDSSEMSSSELARKTGLEKKVVSARISELKQSSKVSSPSTGKYRVKEGRLREILSDLRKFSKEAGKDE